MSVEWQMQIKLVISAMYIYALNEILENRVILFDIS